MIDAVDAMSIDEHVPVVAVRLAEGRTGSTLLMQLLATGEGVVFDDRYPSEYRFLSYFARVAEMATEPFDAAVHPGVTPFFFSAERVWGPVPFVSEVVDVADLRVPALAGLWTAWSQMARRRHPGVRAYAEKIAIDVDTIAAAGIPLRVIDLVRDPRDVLASIRAFTASGIDGFGRSSGMDESEYLESFVSRFATGLEAMARPLPAGVERLLVRYEDLVGDLDSEASRIGDWLGIDLDAGHVRANRPEYAHHMTSDSAESSIGRWRRDLLPADAERVAEALGPAALALGVEL